MRVSGYADSSEIFADIESGKVGARQRGEIRTLRELDRISIAREQGILGGLDAPPSAVPDDIATEEDKPVTPDIEAEFGEGVLVTPDISFEDVQADTDPITGVLLTLEQDKELVYIIMKNFHLNNKEEMQKIFKHNSQL